MPTENLIGHNKDRESYAVSEGETLTRQALTGKRRLPTFPFDWPIMLPDKVSKGGTLAGKCLSCKHLVNDS